MTAVSDKWLKNRQAPTGAQNPFPTDLDAFDYVINNRADLVNVVEPVSGVFTLPEGSYAITGLIELEAGEDLVLATNSATYIQGMSPGDGFTGDSANPLLTIPTGTLVILNGLTVHNDTGSAVSSDGEVDAQRCALSTDGASDQTLVLSSGVWHGSFNDIQGPAFRAVIHTSGDWLEIGSSFGASTTTIDIRNTANNASLIGCTIVSGQNGVRSRGLRNAFIDCDISVGQDNAAAIAALETVDLLVKGGTLRGSVAGSNRSGVWVQTDYAGSIQLEGVTFDLLNVGVRHTTTATVISFSMYNCVCHSNVGVGISWTNSLFPTAALIVGGCGFLGATPFSGFDATAARANIRQCYDSTGLLTETAIVP